MASPNSNEALEYLYTLQEWDKKMGIKHGYDGAFAGGLDSYNKPQCVIYNKEPFDVTKAASIHDTVSIVPLIQIIKENIKPQNIKIDRHDRIILDLGNLGELWVYHEDMMGKNNSFDDALVVTPRADINVIVLGGGLKYSTFKVSMHTGKHYPYSLVWLHENDDGIMTMDAQAYQGVLLDHDNTDIYTGGDQCIKIKFSQYHSFRLNTKFAATLVRYPYGLNHDYKQMAVLGIHNNKFFPSMIRTDFDMNKVHKCIKEAVSSFTKHYVVEGEVLYP